MSASAQVDEEPMMDAADASSAASEQDSGQALASVGSFRYVVWQEAIGSHEIFFNRSTDGGKTWQTAKNLSNDAGYSLDPQIAVSGSNVYITWVRVSSDKKTTDIVFRASDDNGQTWGSKMKIGDAFAIIGSGTFIISTPRIAASSSNVYVVWDNPASISEDILFRRSTDDGSSWMPIKNLSEGSGSPVNVQMAVDESNVYVIWGTQALDLVFRRSTDDGATWKAKVRLSASGTSYLPQVAASGSNVYVTWSELGNDDDVLLRRSSNFGGSWGSLVNISNSGSASSPEIAASRSNVYVSWYDSSSGNGDVYFRRSIDGGALWQSVKNLSKNAGDSSGPRMAISGTDVYVVWHDNTSGNTDIMLRKSTDNGATLGPKVRLSNNPGSSFGPQIDVSESSIFVAWNDYTPGNQEIFSRRSADDGSTWKSVTNLSKTPNDSSLGGIAL